MKLPLSLSLALAIALPAASVLAIPASSPHAASCVAALKAQEAGLSASLKAGAAVEPQLLTVVRSGIAIIGAQYLAGLGEAEARELLTAADANFQTLPRAAAEARQAQCLREGDAIYKGASSLERGLITNAAQRRIKRLLAAA